MTLKLDSEYSQICQLIDQHDLISFDVYDTALLRNVLYPADIFDIVEIELKGKGIFLSNFKQIRVRAEEKARSNSNKEDIHLNDIYRIISKKVGVQLSEQIKEIELSLEERFTIANSFIKRVYEYARSKRKNIIFISDMYLDKQFIGSLLNKNGYDCFELYVSGELGISKASSNMYRYVKGKLQENQKWLHIGDNYISDYTNARNNGITAYYYRALRDRVILDKQYTIEYSIMKAIQVNYSYTLEDMSYWERFGVNTVSSLFFGFTNWLVKQLKGKDNVYFLSRDGYLPYKIYKMFQKVLNGQLPEARYIYASRRAYQIPNIVCEDQKQALDVLTAYNSRLDQKITLDEIFRNLGLSRESYTKLLDNHGINNKFDIKSKRDRNKLKEIIRTIYPDILNKFQQEIELLNKYFKQNMLHECREINLVDVGWRCSTQQAIQNITKIKTNGYYFGTAHNVYENIRNNVRGYAFHLGKPLRNANAIMNNVMMYELIFSAPHGSVVGFREEGSTVVPVLKDVEKNEYLYECINVFQSGVLKIIVKYLDYYDYLKNVDVQDCLKDYVKFIDEKNYDDLMEFSKLTGAVGIGDTREVQRFVVSASISEYLKDKRKIEETISKNLWRGALILHGSLTELKKEKRSESSIILWTKRVSILIVKGIRNPKKAVQFLKRRWIRK